MSIRIAAIGLSHPHILNQVKALVGAGAELVWFWGAEPEKIAQFAQLYPQAKQAREIDEILDDDSIDLVASAAIPCERADLGIQVMQHGKDFSSAKPAFTTLDQLAEVRRVQAETQPDLRYPLRRTFRQRLDRQGGGTGTLRRDWSGNPDDRVRAAPLSRPHSAPALGI